MPPVQIRKSDYIRALDVAEKFNLQAQARPVRKVQGVLRDALAFLDGVKNEVANGNTISTGSAWHGPDDFLTKDIATQWAQKTERIDQLAGDMILPVTKREKKMISGIKKAFNLSSDKQAAGLAIRVYASVADGLWRGNGFSYENANVPALDTQKVKNKLFPQTP